MFRIKFWGVRGSIPSPLTDEEIEEKIVASIRRLNSKEIRESTVEELKKILRDRVPFFIRSTYGGNTTCVEVRCGKRLIVLDMGTGLRPLGNSLMLEMLKNKGLKVDFFLSHVHWDHIQGFPFFAPIYLNKALVKNKFSFYGGLSWQQTIDTCLRGQMDPPNFPVSLKEIEETVEKMEYYGIHDMRTFELEDGESNSPIRLTSRKLDHPQETYGWRIEYQGKVFAFTTDNEPRDPKVPDRKLLFIANNADVWATDCQYTRDIYNGFEGGVPRHGWGHSYPEAVVETAFQANVKRVILTHHDPASSDRRIFEISAHAKSLVSAGLSSAEKINFDVEAAEEGMTIILD